MKMRFTVGTARQDNLGNGVIQTQIVMSDEHSTLTITRNDNSLSSVKAGEIYDVNLSLISTDQNSK